MEKFFSDLLVALPPIIARNKVSAFTGGAVSSGTLANHDAQGTGPENRLTINGKVCYSREALVAWLRQRAASSSVKSITQKAKVKKRHGGGEPG